MDEIICFVIAIVSAAIVGFSVEYFLRRNLRLFYVWPWERTGIVLGAAVGLFVGFISVQIQIRPFIFGLSFGELFWSFWILAFLSWFGAGIGAIVASEFQLKSLSPIQKKAVAVKEDNSYANEQEIFLLGHKFRRMTPEEREKLNYSILVHHRDLFIYWLARKEGYIVYEPARAMITDVSRGFGAGYRPAEFAHWIGLSPTK